MNIMIYPHFAAPYRVEIEQGVGGHGGGDPVMLRDIFDKKQEDRFNRAASHIDGAMSIMTGIAANRSIRTGQPIKVDDLIQFPKGISK
ncbi:hypothetical protein GCM10008933_47290 [Paenibacillus motobuensis]|uniref:Gfo/Idh/MocA-like oxidoreductase C-terminal domain-containing protein n=1 Tax=Paenibacillus motobuensis TaxID=295324 RepID=A0ABN0YUR2_9BACL